jgi:glucose-1-phosphate thymidylyltransferase
MIDRGVRFKTAEVNSWYDCGKKEIILETNAILLDRKEDSEIDPHSFEQTILIPPVSIGKGCQISNSVIGPHVTIGDHANVRHSIIKDSIIGSYATIVEVVLHKSVVGNDAAILGFMKTLNIGDNTVIDFS